MGPLGPSTADIDGTPATGPSSTDAATAPVTDEGALLDEDSALAPEDGETEVTETTSSAVATAAEQAACALMVALGLAVLL